MGPGKNYKYMDLNMNKKSKSDFIHLMNTQTQIFICIMYDLMIKKKTCRLEMIRR